MTTPPVVVALSDSPASSLLIFVGQELEHWGFVVDTDPPLTSSRTIDALRVRAGDVEFTLRAAITEGVSDGG